MSAPNFEIGRKCVACKPGQYTCHSHSVYQCTDCPPGFGMNTVGTNVNQCMPCKAGEITWNGQCTPCPAGRYCPASLAASQSGPTSSSSLLSHQGRACPDPLKWSPPGSWSIQNCTCPPGSGLKADKNCTLQYCKPV